MATWVQTEQCDACLGVHKLGIKAVWLVRHDAPGVCRDYYAWICPTTGQEARVVVDEETCQRLIRARVRVETEHIPLEVVEPHDGEPIGYDDILDLVQALADDTDWRAELQVG